MKTAFVASFLKDVKKLGNAKLRNAVASVIENVEGADCRTAPGFPQPGVFVVRHENIASIALSRSTFSRSTVKISGWGQPGSSGHGAISLIVGY